MQIMGLRLCSKIVELVSENAKLINENQPVNQNDARSLKDLKLYKKESSAEKMMRVYSDEERSKLLNSHKNK